LASTAAMLEADDTTTAAAVTPDTAAGDVLELDDVAVGAAAIVLASTAAMLEADDIAAGVVFVPDYAVASIVEADDTLVAALAGGGLTALAAVLEADDVASATAALRARAIAGIVEADDFADGSFSTVTNPWYVAPENVGVAAGARSRVPLVGGTRFRGVLPSLQRDRKARPLP
jgi:hypothetical protein